MQLTLYILLMLATFIFMEGLAWFMHKYIMHGLMWHWHESHHSHHRRRHWWERNDWFGIVFSIVAVVLIVVGSEMPQLRALLWVGLGVTLYGVAYFVFHDIIVHRRINVKYTPQSKYMKRIIKAHYIHHKVHERDGAEAFGFLYAPKRYDTKLAGKAFTKKTS